jgi:hypothetical protein
MRLIFGRITNSPSETDRTIAVDQVGEVRISLQHAKRLAAILSAQVQSYEAAIGPITIPDE